MTGFTSAVALPRAAPGFDVDATPQAVTCLREPARAPRFTAGRAPVVVVSSCYEDAHRANSASAGFAGFARIGGLLSSAAAAVAALAAFTSRRSLAGGNESSLGRSSVKDAPSTLQLPLKNTYYIVRHGQSNANVKGIICSDPVNGLKHEFGLSELGRAQATAAGRKFKSLLGGSTQKVVIISSDFRRAVETAELIGQEVPHDTMKLVPELRERNFGSLEGGPTGTEKDAAPGEGYPGVWAQDAKSADSKHHGSESVNSVFRRVMTLLEHVEKQYSGRKVLFVSHGDVLQILQCGIAGDDLRMHTRYALSTAELRELKPGRPQVTKCSS